MKKLLTLAILPVLFICSCGSNNNPSGGGTGQETRKTVTLTKSNLEDYIAIYARTTAYGDSYTYVIYYYDFVGSSLCKFNDCSITYRFANNKDPIDYSANYTAILNISGCGQTKEATLSHYYSANSYYKLDIVSVTGTVDVLY